MQSEVGSPAVLHYLRSTLLCYSIILIMEGVRYAALPLHQYILDKNILDSLLLVPTHSVPPIPKLVWLTEEENPPGTASTAMKCYRFLFDSSHPDIIPWPEYAKTITPTPQRTWTAEEVQKVLQEEDEERGLKRSDKRGEPFTTNQELNSPLMGMKPVSFEEMAEA